MTPLKIDVRKAVDFFLDPLRRDADKYANGKVAVIAGSSGMTGAAILCARACMRSGAGLVYSVLPGTCLRTAEPALTEAVKCPVGVESDFFTEADSEKVIDLSKDAKAVVIGPGLGRNPETVGFVRRLLGNSEFAPKAEAVVIDADALFAYSNDGAALTEASELRPGKTVITPHEGEAARLLGIGRDEVSRDRTGTLMKLSALTGGGIAVLKGSGTLVANGNAVFVNTTGNPGMGTGGSGDVLAGIIAGFAASGYGQSLANIVNYGVALHGLSGDIEASAHSERFITASDLIKGLGEIKKYAGQYQSMG